MYIPCIQKVSYRNNILIERSLNSRGIITVASGTELKPYTELGQTSSAILLSGVWGTVEDVVDEYSVLIKSSFVDLHLAVATIAYTEGELIVFPNPSDLIQRQYLDKYAYSLGGKIIYTGNNLTLNIAELARSYKVAGILAGGCVRSTFEYARDNNLFLGLFTGFGNCRTPDTVFDVLNDVATRRVFVSGEERFVRVPVPELFFPDKSQEESEIFKEVIDGLRVFVLQTPYFGSTGHVISVGKLGAVVKLSSTGEIVEVPMPNMLALG